MEFWGTDIVEDYHLAVTSNKLTIAEAKLPFESVVISHSRLF